MAGGVIAPIVLMFSLRNTPASTASLLLNFEGVATTLIAVIAFKEAIGRRIWLAVALITAASILLSLFYISLPILIMGAILILGEEHEHVHLHNSIEHEHRHSHNDEHHTHTHISGLKLEHTHLHIHACIEHSHEHTPDIHHRHVH